MYIIPDSDEEEELRSVKNNSKKSFHEHEASTGKQKFNTSLNDVSNIFTVEDLILTANNMDRSRHLDDHLNNHDHRIADLEKKVESLQKELLFARMSHEQPLQAKSK